VASTCLLPATLDAWASFPFTSDRTLERVAEAKYALDNLLPHVISHLILAQGLIPTGILPQVAYTLVGQAWSISLEWQFYLLAPLVFGALLRPIAAIAVIFVFVFLHFVPGMTDAFIGHKAQLFAVGIASYFYAKSVSSRADSKLSLAALIAAVTVALIIGRKPSLLPLAIWIVSLASVVHFDAPVLRTINRLLGSRVLVWLGERSYSAYLVHMIPLSLGVGLLNSFNLKPLAYATLLTTITSLSTLLLSAVTYIFIEKPGISAGARTVNGLTQERYSPAE
jgi:peptidoglycan/LPS O-acetylase OafA/YrhL